MATFHDQLAAVVGERNVTQDPCKIAALFARPPESAGLFLVKPATVEHVQALARLCGAAGVPARTTSDTLFPRSAGQGERAVLLDFSRMNAIERLDNRNLMAHVGRGVTFEQLSAALSPMGMKLNMPAAATSPSVAEQFTARAVSLRACRYHEVAASNLQVVLADGRVHLTGSHALSEFTADHKGDGGANLSQWYLGADDCMGIVTRASVWCFPIWERSVNLAYGFPDQASAAGFIREISRRELVTMGLVMNAAAFREKIKADPSPAPFVAVAGVEGIASVARVREKALAETARTHGGADLSALLSADPRVFERPWYATGRPRLGFYSRFPRVPDFDAVLSEQGFDPDAVSRFLVSVALGGCVWVEWGFSECDADRMEDLSLSLAAAGAFFDRPHGRLAAAVYGSMDPACTAHLSRVKRMLDPAGTLNPAQGV